VYIGENRGEQGANTWGRTGVNTGANIGANMKLTGDRNQCQGCKEYFNSTFAFDKHRTGDFGVNRRCKTRDEMEGMGMSINHAGFWISSAYGGPWRGIDGN
jgi:hypothetical protein